MASTLSGAIETAPVASLHPVGSASPADFPVPGGREEEWRFTPLRRLRALHNEAPLGMAGVTIEATAAPETLVHWAERHGATPSASTFLPANRVSARAYAAAEPVLVVTVPKEAEATAPVYLRVTGTGLVEGAATAGHIVIDVQDFGRATVVI